jgi:hypothetical protein
MIYDLAFLNAQMGFFTELGVRKWTKNQCFFVRALISPIFSPVGILIIEISLTPDFSSVSNGLTHLPA